jgi:maleylacetoacetate isomerase
MSKVVLYDYWRSSASYRVRIALNVLDIEYRTVPVDLLEGAHKRPDYLTLNPQGLVPTLAIDGRVMTQSLAIIEYLSETRPNAGILPADPFDRQRVRALAQAVAMEIHPICNLRVASHVVELTGDDGARAAWMRRFIGAGLVAVEAMLKREARPFCFGNRPTMADFCLVPQLYNARRWKVDLAPFERIIAIDAECSSLTAFQSAHPDAVAGSTS